MLPRYHLDLRAAAPCASQQSGIGDQTAGSAPAAPEVAAFRAGQGLAPNVLSLWNGGWKTRFLIAFSILHIYYDTEISYCQQKKRKSGVRNRAEK